ncbi:MAG: hypothetical protein ACKVH5_03585, partial [Fidelibacterota bacterium]
GSCGEFEEEYPDGANILGWIALEELRNKFTRYNIEYVSIDFKCAHSDRAGGHMFRGEVTFDIVGEGTKEDKIDAVKKAHRKLVQSLIDASDDNLELEDPN